MTMGFYYTSFFSIVPLGIAYGLLALLYWALVRGTRGVRGRAALLGLSGIVFLLGPVAEELWIAWNFGQSCKEAGTYIHRKVQVEGFYDDSGGGSLELVQSGRYRFVEARGRNGYTRLMKGDAEFLGEALARYSIDSAGQEVAKQDVIRVKLNDRIEALVYPRRGESWRIELLDRPSARYHFKMTDPMGGTRIAHKVIGYGSVVVDTESNTEIARYRSYGRQPPWYFVWLDTPAFACDAPGRWPLTKGTALIYPDVLIPIGQK